MGICYFFNRTKTLKLRFWPDLGIRAVAHVATNVLLLRRQYQNPIGERDHLVDTDILGIHMGIFDRPPPTNNVEERANLRPIPICREYIMKNSID